MLFVPAVILVPQLNLIAAGAELLIPAGSAPAVRLGRNGIVLYKEIIKLHLFSRCYILP